MSEKKSFLLYDDMAAPVETLSDEEAGQLFKYIFAYRNKTNGVKPLGVGAAMAFQFIKQQLERDGVKWEEKAENSRKNGSKGGRPPKEIENPENPVGYFETQKTQWAISKPRKPVNGNVNVNVNVNGNEKNKNPDYVEMVDLLISKIEENDPKYFFGKNKNTKRDNWYDHIRLLVEKDKRTLEEIKHVINWCQSDDFWKTNILSTFKLRKQFGALIIKTNIISESNKPSPAIKEFYERQRKREEKAYG